MEDLPPETEKQWLAASAEWGDTDAVKDGGSEEHCRPSCTASSNQVCQINDCLSVCNELLFDIGLQLREEGATSLSLVYVSTSDTSTIHQQSAKSFRANTFLRWLLRTHHCITSLYLGDIGAEFDSRVILDELQGSSSVKVVNVSFDDDETVQTHITTLLPRLPCLEQLTCSSTCNNDDALVSAVSELLRTSNCLIALNFSACFDYSQPPKTFMDALAANSTLEFLDLSAHWATAEPPGVLGEYVRSNRLLSRLTVLGHDVDREDLLLAECLMLNSTLSTLYILNVCGGKTTVRFLTMILEGCASVRSLYIGIPRDRDAAIPEDIVGRCAEAMAANVTLKWLALPYSLWNARNWITFFALLPRNKHLERLEISHTYYNDDYATFPPVLETVAQTSLAARVSFGYCLHGSGVNLMHFRVFSSIDICGEDNVRIDALQQLRAFAHFTSLTMDVSEAGERLLFSLAEYIRETTLLRELRLCLTNPQRPSRPAPSTCWMTLFDSILVNASISRLGIFSNGNFQHNGRLVNTIALSRSITRVSFMLNVRQGTAADFVSLLSEAIGNNYVLLQVDLHGAKVGADARHCLFTVKDTTRRNSGLVERAAAFIETTHLDWYAASTLEKVSRYPGLVREVATKKGIPADEMARMVRSRLRSVEGLHDFMRLTGVVKEHVTCMPPADGCSMQLQDLNSDCWDLVKRRLSFDDVKRFTVASRRAPRLAEHKKPL